MTLLYAPFNRNHERTFWMDVRSAEFTKYAANAMLATRISFMNELANLADRVGVDIEAVRHGIGSDPRIGHSFLYAGCGYGGSCFPKDVQALERTAREHGQELLILQAVEAVNDRQKHVLGNKIVARFGEDLAGRHFALWGLAFKPNTDDMREASSRVLLRELIERGATVAVYDPVAMAEARRVLALDFAGSASALARIRFADSPMDALREADALAIVTEWKAFRSPDFDQVQGAPEGAGHFRRPQPVRSGSDGACRLRISRHRAFGADPHMNPLIPGALERARILVVGDVMLDRYWFGDVNRISPEAPVPVVRIEKREERLGGAANVARNIAALGAQASLLGVVGQDEAGDAVDELLAKANIGSYLQRDQAISTIIKLRVIGRQQQLLRIDFEQPPGELVLRDKLSQFNALLAQYDVIVLSDYAKGSLVNVAEMIAAAQQNRQAGAGRPQGRGFFALRRGLDPDAEQGGAEALRRQLENRGGADCQGAAAAALPGVGSLAADAFGRGHVALLGKRSAAHSGDGARSLRRLGRRRHGHCDAGRHAGRRHDVGRCRRDRQPRRRHRGG